MWVRVALEVVRSTTGEAMYVQKAEHLLACKEKSVNQIQNVFIPWEHGIVLFRLMGS